MSQKTNDDKKAISGVSKDNQILDYAESTRSKSAATANGNRGDNIISISEDQLARLISSVLTTVTKLPSTNKRHPSSSASIASYSTTNFRQNFSGFTARFNGVVQSPEEFEAFVDSLVVYKEWASIDDAYALRNLSKLLTGKAGHWWRGVKSTITTWDEAIYQLRSMYGAPAYKILQQIFEEKQGEEWAEMFILRAREKFLCLPYRVPEVMQVDIVYGLLNPRIRERIRREDIPADLCTLAARATDVEEILIDTDVAS